MHHRFAWALVFLAATALGYPLTPNQEWAPGKLCTKSNPDFVEYRYKEKVPYCHRNVSDGLKSKLYDRYKVPKNERNQYTIDHVIPLSIGGSNEAANLWPEHKKVKATRPDLEETVFIGMKEGSLLQADAVQIVLDEKFTPHEELELEDALYGF